MSLRWAGIGTFPYALSMFGGCQRIIEPDLLPLLYKSDKSDMMLKYRESFSTIPNLNGDYFLDRL